eukprot:8463346-Pyramimonas_sp.AAC.1
MELQEIRETGGEHRTHGTNYGIRREETNIQGIHGKRGDAGLCAHLPGCPCDPSAPKESRQQRAGSLSG